MTHKLNIDEKLNFFLSQYFYELEIILNTHTTEISSVKFQSEESNTDEYLKEYIGNIISLNNTIKNHGISALSLTYGQQTKSMNVEDFNKFRIIKILRPNELTPDLKERIKASKSSVYTNPDLLLEIKGYGQTFYESVELKSTKNNKISGSSVQQVNPYEWVIFIKRKKNNIQVSTGHYINSITEKLPFPDRSPRPQIGFNNLVEWNRENRIFDNQKISYTYDSKVNHKKLKILADWQEFLADEWLTVIQSKTKLKNEKWFNNALRKFAIKFLDYSENLDAKSLKELKTQLKKLID